MAQIRYLSRIRHRTDEPTSLLPEADMVRRHKGKMCSLGTKVMEYYAGFMQTKGKRTPVISTYLGCSIELYELRSLKLEGRKRSC